MLIVPYLSHMLTGVDWRYFVAGGAACSISHGVTVPFDVVKTRIQLQKSSSSDVLSERRQPSSSSSYSSPASGRGKGGSRSQSLAKVDAEVEINQNGYLYEIQSLLQREGVSAFSVGVGETLTGYAVQGSLKYGFFQQFKPMVRSALDVQHTGDVNTLLVLIIAGALAEVIGSTALTPFEALRIRAVSSSASSFSSSDKGRKRKFSNREDESVNLFKGLPAIIAKQVPFTMVQLSTFELLTSFLYSSLAANHIDVASSPIDKFAITATAAVIAGALSTLFSQPGDTVLSASNKSNSRGSSSSARSVPEIVVDIYRKDGLPGFFTGVQARLVHVMFMVVTQLLVYDYIKQLFGIAATGSH